MAENEVGKPYDPLVENAMSALKDRQFNEASIKACLEIAWADGASFALAFPKLAKESLDAADIESFAFRMINAMMRVRYFRKHAQWPPKAMTDAIEKYVKEEALNDEFKIPLVAIVSPPAIHSN